jgi:hypothetical protein
MAYQIFFLFMKAMRHSIYSTGIGIMPFFSAGRAGLRAFFFITQGLHHFGGNDAGGNCQYAVAQ